MRWASPLWLGIITSWAFASIATAGRSGRFDVQYATQPVSQDGTPQNVLGSVTQGNTTIIFEAANPTDLDMQHLQTWDEFANSHPRIASALAYKPSLISDEAYLGKNPELSAFFQAHPDIRDAMVENPGDFAAIPPRPGE
jgi:hypothetical protein